MIDLLFSPKSFFKKFNGSEGVRGVLKFWVLIFLIFLIFKNFIISTTSQKTEQTLIIEFISFISNLWILSAFFYLGIKLWLPVYQEMKTVFMVLLYSCTPILLASFLPELTALQIEPIILPLSIAWSFYLLFNGVKYALMANSSSTVFIIFAIIPMLIYFLGMLTSAFPIVGFLITIGFMTYTVGHIIRFILGNS